MEFRDKIKQLRKLVEEHIIDICNERNLPPEPVLEKLQDYSDDNLVECFEEAWLKLN